MTLPSKVTVCIVETWCRLFLSRLHDIAFAWGGLKGIVSLWVSSQIVILSDIVKRSMKEWQSGCVVQYFYLIQYDLDWLTDWPINIGVCQA